MKTVHTIPGGRCTAVLRSNGQVYLVDAPDTVASDFRLMDHYPKLVATTSAGCQALGEALIEMAGRMRENNSRPAPPAECRGCSGPDCEGCQQSPHWYWFDKVTK